MERNQNQNENETIQCSRIRRIEWQGFQCWYSSIWRCTSFRTFGTCKWKGMLKYGLLKHYQNLLVLNLRLLLQILLLRKKILHWLGQYFWGFGHYNGNNKLWSHNHSISGFEPWNWHFWLKNDSGKWSRNFDMYWNSKNSFGVAFNWPGLSGWVFSNGPQQLWRGS